MQNLSWLYVKYYKAHVMVVSALEYELVFLFSDTERMRKMTLTSCSLARANHAENRLIPITDRLIGASLKRLYADYYFMNRNHKIFVIV